MNALSTMGRQVTRWLWLGMAWFLLMSGVADARFFPVEAIRPGMRGTGKTVLHGTDVESFEVEYIGVMRDAGPSGDLILVRVSGAAIERSGGIAAGMSGSPVYIDDQLVGAIGYGFNMADHRVGLVTPIGDMLDVLQLVPTGHPGAEKTARHPRGVILTSSIEEAEALHETVAVDTLVFAPVQTPLLASGFGLRALADLEQRLQPFHLTPVMAGGAVVEGRPPVMLEPGSAFGVQLARGDVTLTSIGTVTYVEGDRFIGFGHPFTNRGPVEFVASSAYVHDVVHAATMPFKLGAPLEPVGTLVQDRGAAVAAQLGPQPDMIPVTVSIHDVDRNKTSLQSFEIVRDKEYTVALATSGALALLDRGLDRLGRGTAHVVFRVEGEGLSRPLVRDNMYYSDFDVSALSLLEFMEGISLVVNNRFQPVNVTRIHLSAHVEQQRRTAHIEDARPSKNRVQPGETIDVFVSVRPYHEPAVTERLQITIPDDAAPGAVTVEVRGGGWGLRPPLAEDEDTILDDPEAQLGETVSDLEKLVEQFVRRERNNELVAEFYASRGRFADGENGGPAQPVANDGQWHQTFPGGGWVVSSIPTDFVLLGSEIFELHIAGGSSGDAKDADDGANRAVGDDIPFQH